MTGHYTLMSCNGLEWIQPPSNQSRIPGSYGYYDPPLAIVNELNRLVDRIKRLEEKLNESKYRIGRLVDVGDMILSNNPTRVFADEAWRLAKEDKP